MDSVPDGESLYVGRVDNHGALEMRGRCGKPLTVVFYRRPGRRYVQALALRNRAEGGRFSLAQSGGRLFWISLLVGLYVLYLWFRVTAKPLQIEREGWRATATVVERVGRSGMDEHKFLVRFCRPCWCQRHVPDQ